MRLDLQAKLLRVLQEQEFERVGGTRADQASTCASIATTNRDLAAEATPGSFARTSSTGSSVIPMLIPPLRERLEDIPLLAHALRVARGGRCREGRARHFARGACVLLQQHEWPGNVRELQHVIERAVIMSSDSMLQARSLDQETFGRGRAAASHSEGASTNGATNGATSGAANGGASGDLHDGVVLTSLSLDHAEEVLIAKALEVTRRNRTRAAALLGISVRTLRYKLNGPPPSTASEAADD